MSQRRFPEALGLAGNPSPRRSLPQVPARAAVLVSLLAVITVLVALGAVGRPGDGHDPAAPGSAHGMPGTAADAGTATPGAVPLASWRGSSPGPGLVADRFAIAFEATPARASPVELAARVRPWVAASLERALAAPDGGGTGAPGMPNRAVRVVSTTVEDVTPAARAGPASQQVAAQALVAVDLKLVASGGPRSQTVALALRLELLGGHWEVAGVPGLVG